jgi:hypothetical protein
MDRGRFEGACTMNRNRATFATRFARRRARRGVASVLSMMFLVIFGSLAAVMAIVAQGNLRTADSYLKVTRASSSAEMGLIFARRRLLEASRRFVVSKGVVTDDFGTKLWMGTYTGGDGTVTVLAPDDFVENPPAESIAEAVRNAHAADDHNIDVDGGDALLPDIDEFGTLRVKPVGELDADGNPMSYFRLKYEILEDGRFVRVTSQGVDGDVQRTLQMDFRINKKIEYAVISPNRVMIGKNVRIEGPLGNRYGVVAGELTPAHGNPLVMRSDFYHLDPDLDTDLDALYAAIQQFDVDGDARLRPAHATEVQGIGGNVDDHNGDEYVDDYDLFMFHMDANSDSRVVYDEDLAAAAGLGILAEELTADEQLGHLIDFAFPDRNLDGTVNSLDTALGYGDGVVDSKDVYAKMHGSLAFAVAKSDWEDARGGTSYQSFVNGPHRLGPDESAITFEVSEEDLLDITTADFAENETWMKDKALAGAPFDSQRDDNIANGAIYTEAADADWETVPYGAKGYYDWYQRPVYEDMTFTDVAIPMGNNGLFVNCTFIGVTYIQTHQTNGDVNWNYVGMKDKNLVTGDIIDKYAGLQADLGDGTMVDDTKPYSNNIRFHNCTIAGSIVVDPTDEYTHTRNKIQFTGATVFTLDHPDLSDEDIAELEKSSIMAPGYSVDVGNFTNDTSIGTVELTGTIIAGVMDVRGTADVHGTLLMTFRPVEGEGPLYYGGTTDNFNTTIGYFGPDDGDAESVDPSTLTDTDGDGIPDIGLDLDGDGVNDPFSGFGEITIRYNPDGKLPDGIPWPIIIEAEPDTYVEGGVM